MDATYGMFVTTDSGMIKSYKGNIIDNLKLKDFRPVGAFIEDFFPYLSPFNEDFLATHDPYQALMTNQYSSIPVEFDYADTKVVEGKITASKVEPNSKNSDLVWYFDENLRSDIDLDRAHGSPIYHWSKCVSHDINNPLQVLMSVSERLSRQIGKDPARVEKEIERITRFIDKSIKKISKTVNYMNLVSGVKKDQFSLYELDFMENIFKERLDATYDFKIYHNEAIQAESVKIHLCEETITSIADLVKDHLKTVSSKNSSVSLNIEMMGSSVLCRLNYTCISSDTYACRSIYDQRYVSTALCALVELVEGIGANIQIASDKENEESLIIELPNYANILN